MAKIKKDNLYKTGVDILSENMTLSGHRDQEMELLKKELQDAKDALDEAYQTIDELKDALKESDAEVKELDKTVEEQKEEIERLEEEAAGKVECNFNLTGINDIPYQTTNLLDEQMMDAFGEMVAKAQSPVTVIEYLNAYKPIDKYYVDDLL